MLKTRNYHDGVCDYTRQQHSVGLLRHFYFINYIFKQTNSSCPGFEAAPFVMQGPGGFHAPAEAWAATCVCLGTITISVPLTVV